MFEEKYSPHGFEMDWAFDGSRNARPRKDVLEHEELYKKELLIRIEKKYL